mgnify:CR=1 FL=1|jgi:hypothetical protein
MLSLVSAAQGLNVRSAVITTPTSRVPAASMAIETKFVYEPPAALGKSLGLVLEGMEGKVVPTGSMVAAPKPVSPVMSVERPFVYEPPATLAKSLGLSFDFEDLSPPAVVKPVKPMETTLVYERQLDSSKGPPCGVAHHQGSGTGPF